MMLQSGLAPVASIQSRDLRDLQKVVELPLRHARLDRDVGEIFVELQNPVQAGRDRGARRPATGTRDPYPQFLPVLTGCTATR